MADTSRTETEHLKALSRRWFEEVWNQKRSATVDELMAADCAIHGLDAPSAAGPAAGPAKFQAFAGPFQSAFPDLHIDVEDVIAEGDQTAVRLCVRATHTGPGLGVAPTGRAVRFTAICVLRWRDGKLVEGWNEFDAAGMYRQIGLPASGPARGG